MGCALVFLEGHAGGPGSDGVLERLDAPGQAGERTRADHLEAGLAVLGAAGAALAVGDEEAVQVVPERHSTVTAHTVTAGHSTQSQHSHSTVAAQSQCRSYLSLSGTRAFMWV